MRAHLCCADSTCCLHAQGDRRALHLIARMHHVHVWPWSLRALARLDERRSVFFCAARTEALAGRSLTLTSALCEDAGLGASPRPARAARRRAGPRFTPGRVPTPSASLDARPRASPCVHLPSPRRRRSRPLAIADRTHTARAPHAHARAALARGARTRSCCSHRSHVPQTLPAQRITLVTRGWAQSPRALGPPARHEPRGSSVHPGACP